MMCYTDMPGICYNHVTQTFTIAFFFPSCKSVISSTVIGVLTLNPPHRSTTRGVTSYWPQCSSSDPSSQSGLRSHLLMTSIQWDLLHWNSFGRHPEIRQEDNVKVGVGVTGWLIGRASDSRFHYLRFEPRRKHKKKLWVVFPPESKLLCWLAAGSSWYDFRGWLGVKQQLSIYLLAAGVPNRRLYTRV